jgi:hypothetical protein
VIAWSECHRTDQLVHDRQGRNRGLDRGALEVVTKVAWYYLHERVWAAVALGTALSKANPASETAGPLQTGGPVSRN